MTSTDVLESRRGRHTVDPSAGPSFDTPGHRDSRANTRAHQIRFHFGRRNKLCTTTRSCDLQNVETCGHKAWPVVNWLVTAGALNSCVDLDLPHLKAQCMTRTQAACAEVCVLGGSGVPRPGATWSGAAMRNCSNGQERPRGCMPRASYS